MKFIKKYENFEIDSKSKEIGEVKFPEFKGDKIYMLEFSNIVFDYEIEAKIIDSKKHDILEVMTYSYKSFKEF